MSLRAWVLYIFKQNFKIVSDNFVEEHIGCNYFHLFHLISEFKKVSNERSHFELISA